MPRSRRVTWLKQPHLIVAKANDGTLLFSDDDDYKAYLEYLRQQVRDKLVCVHGFCLQKKEIRLVMTPIRMSLARIMQRLHCSHSVRMNQKLKRQGHLFSGRFRSLIIPQQEIVNIVRSVHLWPVRMGLVRRTELYPWSSHSAYVGSEHSWQDIIDTKDILAQFSPSPVLAQRAFSRYVESAALDEDDLGIQEILPGVGSRDENAAWTLLKQEVDSKPRRRISLQMLAKRVGLLLSVSVNHLQGPSRRQDLVMARRLLATVAVTSIHRSVTEVADFIERDKAQVSRLVSQGLDLLDADQPFRMLYESAKGRYATGANAPDDVLG